MVVEPTMGTARRPLVKWSRYNRLFWSERYGRFLYNAQSNTLLELDEPHYQELERLRDSGSDADAGGGSSFLALLRKHKALVEPGEEDRFLLARQYERNVHCFAPAKLLLTLCPTLQCNFRCPYCFEHSQQDRTVMSDQTVARLMTYIRGFKDIRSLSIIWYGGEPLLKFKVICDITEKVHALDLDFQGARLITNGFLLDAKKIARLNALKIDPVQITLDGPEEVHDSRRVLAGGGPTFQRILGNVATLVDSTYQGSCILRVNLDKYNVDRFLELRAALLERFKGKKLFVTAAKVDPSAGYDHARTLDLSDWANFAFDLQRKEVLPPTMNGGFYPTSDIDTNDSICVATLHKAFVVGPEGELYKCWSDVGMPAMVIGSIHAEDPVTNYALQAQYCTGSDAYNNSVCRACDALPICGGGCANKRTREQQFGEAGLDYCSVYRDHLIPYLEAYYDTFRKKELCAAVLRPGRQKQDDRGYRVVSPEGVLPTGRRETIWPTQAMPMPYPRPADPEHAKRISDMSDYDIKTELTPKVRRAIERLPTRDKNTLVANLPTDHDLGRTLQYYADIHELLARRIGEFKGKTIAHLGSSTAVYPHYLNDLGAHAIAIDIAEDASQVAREVSKAAHLQNRSVVRADARKLPLRDGMLDAFVSDHFLFSSYADLEELSVSSRISDKTRESSRILDRLSEVLKPGGIGILANTELAREGRSEMLFALMRGRFEVLEFQTLDAPGPEREHRYLAHLVIRKPEDRKH
jgi:uncharacterized protein